MLSALLLLLGPLAVTHAGFPHVFSGEHFFDLMGTPMDYRLAGRSGVLVLYKAECKHELDFTELSLDKYLMYFTHDYESCPQYTWYKYRPVDDLHQKYASADTPCLSAYYFRKGSSLNRPTEVWQRDKSLKDWVWSLLERTLKIQNGFYKKITVTQSPAAGGPKLPDTSIWIMIKL